MSIAEHILDKGHRRAHLEDICVIQLHLAPKLIVIGESIVAFFAATGELDLSHWEIVLIAILLASSELGERDLGKFDASFGLGSSFGKVVDKKLESLEVLGPDDGLECIGVAVYGILLEGVADVVDIGHQRLQCFMIMIDTSLQHLSIVTEETAILDWILARTTPLLG